MTERDKDKKYAAPMEIGITMSDKDLEAISISYKAACFMGNGVVMFDGEKYRHFTEEELRSE